MKNNEVSTLKPTNVPQTPVTPMPADVPQTPVTPMPTDVTSTQPTLGTPISQETGTPMNLNQQLTASPINTGNKPNGFATLIEKVKSFGINPIVTIAAVAVVLVGVIIISAAASSPKSVFKSAIKTMYKGANTAVEGYETYLDEYDITKKALLVNGKFSIETNVEEYENYNLNKMSIGFDAGVDYKNEILSFGGSLKGNKETVNLNAQYQKNEMYITSSLFEEMLKIDSEMLSELGVDIDFEEVKKGYEEFKKEYDTDPETYDYLAKTIRNALINSIDSEFMEKETDKVDVLDKEIKVTKYSYIFDEDAVQDLLIKVAEYLLEEEDFAKTLADACGVETKDVKELLKEMKSEAKDLDFKEKFALNIYTRGLFNSYAGIGFEMEGKEYFSLYTDRKNIEMTYDDHGDDEYGTKIVMTFEKDGKGYKGVLKENKEKILELKIKEISEEVFDSEFVIYEDGKKEGTIKTYIKFQVNKDKFTTNYEFKITEEESKEYMGFKGDYTIAFKDNIEKTNNKNAISIEEMNVEKITENIEKISEKDEALGNILEEAIDSIEEDMLDLNYNGMSEIEASEVANILKKNKATVLYVGKTYYSYSSEKDAYELFNNLRDLQSELGFYSYYLSDYEVTSEFEELVKDVQYTCSSSTPSIDYEDSEMAPSTPSIDYEESEMEPSAPVTTCSGYPAIYLIKEGKVQKAFAKSVTYTELKDALNEIGIK